MHTNSLGSPEFPPQEAHTFLHLQSGYTPFPKSDYGNTAVGGKKKSFSVKSPEGRGLELTWIIYNTIRTTV